MVEDVTVVGLMIGIGGLLVKEVLTWFRERNLQDEKKRLEGLEAAMRSLMALQKSHDDNHTSSFEQIKKLYEWHDKDDQDGVKIWYVKQSLESVIKDTSVAISILAKNSELQTHLLKEMIESQKITMKEQAEMLKAMYEIQRNVGE